MPLSLMLLMACGPETTLLSGTVYAAPDGREPLENATLTVYDTEGTSWGTTTTDASGTFELESVAGTNVFVEIDAEGYERASFTGLTGLNKTQYIEDGTLFGVSQELRDTWESRFAGCPDVGTGGAVFGEVRLFGYVDEVTGEEQIIRTAWARVEQTDGEEVSACYLDDEGTAYDPDAPHAGDTGQFAVFGLDPGLYNLRVGYFISEGESQTVSHDYFLWIPADGGVSPRFPAYVTLPSG